MPDWPLHGWGTVDTWSLRKLPENLHLNQPCKLQLHTCNLWQNPTLLGIDDILTVSLQAEWPNSRTSASARSSSICCLRFSFFSLCLSLHVSVFVGEQWSRSHRLWRRSCKYFSHGSLPRCHWASFFLCSFNSVVVPDEISGVTEQILFNFVCS